MPCYNEAGRLDAARIVEFVARTPDVGLLLVDDGSTDRTSVVLRDLAERCPSQIGTVRLPENRGKAEAVRAGVLTALEAGARFVDFWDADLATPLEAIPRFTAFLGARPALLAAIGARVQLLGTRIERSRLRHYLGRAFATAASMALGAPVYDTQCGAKLFRVDPIVRTAFARPFRTGWIFDVELLARLGEASRLSGGPPVESLVAELPLETWTDVPGSKLGTSAMLRAGLSLACVRRAARRDVAAAMQDRRTVEGAGLGAAARG